MKDGPPPQILQVTLTRLRQSPLSNPLIQHFRGCPVTDPLSGAIIAVITPRPLVLSAVDPRPPVVLLPVVLLPESFVAQNAQNEFQVMFLAGRYMSGLITFINHK